MHDGGVTNDRNRLGRPCCFRIHPSLLVANLMIAATLLIGCRDDGERFKSLTPEPPAIDERGTTVYFPRQAQDTGDFMDSDHRGQMILDDNGCLRIMASYGGDAHIIIWPPSGIEAAIVDDEVALVSEGTGELIAHVGDWIMLGGGGLLDEPALRLDRPLPEPCAGEGEQYWISGSAEGHIRRIPPES